MYVLSFRDPYDLDGTRRSRLGTRHHVTPTLIPARARGNANADADDATHFGTGQGVHWEEGCAGTGNGDRRRGV